MRRFLFFGLIIVGLALVFAATQSSAQDGGNEEEFVGLEECLACHREVGQTLADFCADADACHGNALLNPEQNEELILADFEQGEELRTVQFPGEDSPRPFTFDDIAFAMGSARYVQRYVYEVEERQYAVFPAEWNVIDEQWQPYTVGETWPTGEAYNFNQNCAGCHVTGINVEEMTWVDLGVQCEACHGPGSSHLEVVNNIPLRPDEEEVQQARESALVSADPQICGQCHSKGTTPDGYHYPVAYNAGGELLAEDTFDLVPPDDSAHWWVTGHSKDTNMQYNEWLKSGHATALESVQQSENAQDSCLSCHSTDYRYNQEIIAAYEAGEREGIAPEAVTLETAQFGVTCTACHNTHAENPEVDYYLADEPYALCSDCHSDPDPNDANGIHHPIVQMFEGQTLVENIEGVPGAHFNAEEGPLCTTCHMPRNPVSSFTLASHTFEPVHPGAALEVEALDDSCTTCHEEQADAAAMQALIDDTQAGTEARLEAIRNSLQGDEPVWVSQALEFIEGDGSLGIHNYAYTDALLDAIEAEINASSNQIGSTLDE
jgi:predicted CXXCH cytochrome family protein